MQRKPGRYRVVYGRCKTCKAKFGGVDMDAHTQEEHFCLYQPKWRVRIFGKTWFYCSDKCLSKHFHYKKIRKPIPKLLDKILRRKHEYRTITRYDYNKEEPKARFKLRLTKLYKLLGYNAWSHKDIKEKDYIEIDVIVD